MSPGPDAPSRAQIEQHLRRAHAVALQSRAAGHHPFGAVLVAPDHTEVLLEQGNLSPVQHAESELARTAAAKYSPDYLWGCTLVSTVEPCAMCAGTQYWANIGRLVYGISERALLQLTGNHGENPTMDVPSRYVFEHSQKHIEVIGPIESLAELIVSGHAGFWS